MKKLLSLALAAIFFASVLSSCASLEARPAIDANVTLTSSDALDAAAWLAERLGGVPGRVVLGTNAAAYGFDLSSLEADGYFIRSFGREDVLFARTADGLDRAVRRYAKMVEAGDVSDVTYHEGYRVKAIELAGRDISEYTVYAAESASRLVSAANEFASLIKKACGAELSVAVGEAAAPYIRFKYVHDEALSSCGYRWSVSDDGLTVECSDKYATAAHFAAIRFIEKELDWFGLSFGYEALSEAELISIPAGKSGGEVNFLEYSQGYGDFCSSYIGDGFQHDYMDLGNIHCCCHGLQNNRFAGQLSKSVNHDWADDQPCYLDDEFFEVVYDDILAYVEDRIAAGEKSFLVDIAAGDNSNWCKCKKCRKMFAEEGGTEAGAVLTWANRLSEAIDEEHPGLRYGVFAYAGTNKLSKTVRPNDLLNITYCFDMSCDSHPHDGSLCDGDLLNHVPYVSYPHLKNHNNTFMGENLREWCEVCDNMFVWFYDLPGGLVTMSAVHTALRDFRFFGEIGVKGVFWQSEDYGFSAGKVQKWLMAELTWNVGMSDEEFDAYYDRVLSVLYGGGWEYVKEYISVVSSIYESGPCLHCWGGWLVEPMWEKRFDAIYELLEAAIPLADCRKQEMRAVKLDASCIYSGCLSSYFNAKQAGDSERLAELERRYALIFSRLAKFGISLESASLTVDSDLEVEAWLCHDSYDWHVRPPKSEMPERVAAIEAEREAAKKDN